MLLDALDAIGVHREAVILVGAQAIYLHTGEGTLALPPYTADGDLTIDPGRLAARPPLEALLIQAGFTSSGSPGTWMHEGIPIDLLVPEAVGGGGRRAARLPGHAREVARKTRGLEGVLVDQSPHTLAAFEESDARRHTIAVAGPAALLVAKLHKILDRHAEVRRRSDKDAYDILRLLQAIPTVELARRLHMLRSDPRTSKVTDEAREALRDLFGSPAAAGSQMAARSVGPFEDPAVVAASCAALAGDLLAVLAPRG